MGGGAAEPQTPSIFCAAALTAVQVTVAPLPVPVQVQVAIEPAAAERVLLLTEEVPAKQKSAEMAVLEPVYEYVVAAEPQAPRICPTAALIATHDAVVPPPVPAQVQVTVEPAAAERVCVVGAIPAKHNCAPVKISDEPV